MRTPTVCQLRIRDGRDTYHEESIASLDAMLPEPDFIVEIDDADHELGFCGAIRQGWEQVARTGATYVVHLEADFIIEHPVPLDRIVAVLARRAEIAQIVLKRQPVNEEEIAAGGIIERDPGSYMECCDGRDVYTTHRCHFSTNVCVYRTSLCRLGWPQEQFSEGIFTHRLLRDPMLRFAYWGGKLDPPLIRHIGEVRAGVGY